MSTESSETLVARLSAAGCVFAEEEAALLIEETGNSSEPDYTDRLEDMVRRRIAGQPLEQILGWAEFCGLRVPVAPGVFIPRRRTELLADHAVQLLATITGPTAVPDLGTRARPTAIPGPTAITGPTAIPGPTAVPGPTVIELCCGSGAVTLAIATHTSPAPTAPEPPLPQMPAPPALKLFAVDLQPEAVECASISLDGLATVLAGDLFSALPRDLLGRVDIVVANAPYIPSARLATLPREARDHEPALTLDGGSDGLDVLRRIVSTSPEWLRPGGYLLLECSKQQAKAVRGIMELHGFSTEIVRRKATDATIAVGRRNPGKAEAPE